jgi:maleylacetoacetate isomerase
MRLYDYFRSSASFRVRIGLNLKGLEVERAPIHLLKDGGEQFSPAFSTLNPQQLVPVLEDGETVLIQSLAILEYLDETHPEPPLLPGGAAARARVRALAQIIACDLHPLDNLRVLKYLKDEMDQEEEARNTWYRHWVAKGLGAFEAHLAGNEATGDFCHGDAPGLADICLVPQIFNAKRLDCPLDDYPVTMAIFRRCMEVPAFDAAQPANQPDAA